MDAPDDWTAGTVDPNGAELQYYRAGDGPSIVLAHGIFDDARYWTHLLGDLREEYDVVAYDARAHGRSAAPASGYGVDDRVADLAGVVHALALDDPVLFGHSMGASTVAWTAARHPDLPRATVLVDPAGFLASNDYDPDQFAEHARERRAEWAAQSTAEVAAEYEADGCDPALARRVAEARDALRPEIEEIARSGFPPVEDALESIACPTLVLKADADPTERTEELDAADRLDEGRLVHVPGAGHTVFRDRFEAASAELRAFLRRVRG